MSLAALQPAILSVIGKLPPSAQQTLFSLVPYFVSPDYANSRRAIAAILILLLVRGFNRSLSRCIENNYSVLKTGLGLFKRKPRWVPAEEVVLVTGGCSGIGQRVAQMLAVERELRVVVWDINEPATELPPNVTFFRVDVTSESSIAAAAAEMRAAVGEPTVVVNNAGVGTDGPILTKPSRNIQRTINVNIMSHFWMVREFVPAMVARNKGHVVTIASAASFIVTGEIVDYASTKAAALAFHEGLRQELKYWYKAPNVKTSIIHPYWVATPLIQKLIDAGTHFHQPIMPIDAIAKPIVTQIRRGESGQVIVPRYSSILRALRAAPWWVQELSRALGSADVLALRVNDKLQDAGLEEEKKK